MTDATTQNPFAPPRAHVQDHFNGPSEMVTATRMSRFLAVLIDASPFFVGGLIAALLIPGMFSSGGNTFGGTTMRAIGSLGLAFGIVCLGWLIWNIVLLYRYGQTVGKKVMGIRVVRMDGSRVTFARFFFLRWLGVAVITWIISAICLAIHLPFLGNLAGLLDALMIFGAARRCLHDYIADTQVVTAESSPNATLAGAQRL